MAAESTAGTQASGLPPASAGPGAGAPPGGPAAMISQMFPLIVIFGIFYLLVLRPQQKEKKKHAEMLNNLKRGDQIITTGGIHGSVVGFKEQLLEVKISDEVKVVLERGDVRSMKPSAPVGTLPQKT